MLEERGRSLECRNSMNQSTKVEIYLKHISRNVNNVGDKHRKVDGRQTVEVQLRGMVVMARIGRLGLTYTHYLV